MCVCLFAHTTSQHISYLNRGLLVCVCERERERERERGSHHSGVYSLPEIVLITACVCVCVLEREGHITVECTVYQKSS